MNDEIHFSASAIVGGLIAIAVSAVGYIIRAAAKQLLASFSTTLKEHTAAIKELSSEIHQVRLELVEVKSRVDAQERWRAEHDG